MRANISSKLRFAGRPSSMAAASALRYFCDYFFAWLAAGKLAGAALLAAEAVVDAAIAAPGTAPLATVFKTLSTGLPTATVVRCEPM